MQATDGFEYRTLVPSDLPAYYAIRFSVTENLIHEHQVGYLQREHAIADIEQGGGSICLYGKEAVGISLPLFVPEPILAALFVSPEYQGRGIGSRLLGLSLQWLRKNGADIVTLETDPGTKAETFYRHRGWIRSHMTPSGVQICYTYEFPQGNRGAQ